MRAFVRLTVLNAGLALVCAVPAAAQAAGIITDLVGDVSGVEKKFVDLAKAIPPDKYDWRPAPGIRSIGEVLKHVASDNYLIPALLGTPAEASTGITTDYKTAQAYEARKMTKDQAIAELQKSFAHLKKAMNATPADKLNASVSFFGQPYTTQKAWVGGTTHLHEHLGQLIAYGRSNGVKPPWS